ncbi:MAG: peptidylprolyl isomerase [Bacteroidota bacterium]
MKKRTLGFLTLTAVGFTAFAQISEPVIMTINEKPVYKSEFENVYKKNSGKEVNKEQKSVKEYVDLFSTFKMKVFEAEANGLDTINSFKTELAGYRKQLAAPYLTDKNVNDALLQEAYERMKTEIRASHILIRVPEDALPKDTIEAYTRLMIIRDALMGKTPTPAKITEYENLLKKSSALSKTSTRQDSIDYNSKLNAVKGIASALNSGNDKFAAVAKKTSEDPSAAENGGDLGYFTSLQMVYPFETAAFKANVGDITMPVRTRFGYHLLKIVDKRPSQGEILTAHIMVKFSKDMGDKDKENLKTKIDEIYTKLKAGEKFEDLARQFSDDKPSAEKGGQLQWFGSSRMPIEFEKAAFALANNGDFSEPFTTTYGWHIVKRIDKKGLASFADMKGDLKQRIGKDSRTQAGKSSLIEKIKKDNNFKENPSAKKEFLKAIDSTVFQGRWEAKKAEKLGKKELFRLSNKDKTGKETTMIYGQNDFAKYIETHQTARPKTDYNMFLNQSYKEFVDETLINYEDAVLDAKYPEFRNLLKEYRDGILLFDLTDQKVWSKAVKDTAGLKAFYEKNKNNYLWDERADVTMYKCANEKVAKEVRAILKKNKSEKEITETINKTSQLNVSVENITYLKGENKDVDANWKQGVASSDIKDIKENKVTVLVVNKLMGKTPKTIAEAKGMITADYQNYLEKEWLAYLKNKYTVKVNEDVLNTVK